MRHESTPESLEWVLRQFKSCFRKPSFRNFTFLVLGWILCRRRRWITRVIAASGALKRKHHSCFYRFFSLAPWCPDAVGKVLFDLLLPYLPELIEVMVDDTLCRRAGPRIFGISMHHDGAASSYGKGASGAYSNLACGHSWVVLSVRVPLPWKTTGMAVPILARLYRSPKRCAASEYKKRTQLAREMVTILAKWLPGNRALHLTGDREYACKTVLRDLDASIQFTGPMPMDALLYGPVPKYQGCGRPRVRGETLANPKAKARSRKARWQKLQVELYGRRAKLLVQSWTCLWYTATGQRLVRVVLTRDPKGNYEDRAFFSTDHQAAPEEILQRFAGRWLIEVSFRDAKQIFGLNDPQNGFAVYGIVIVWYLRAQRWERDVHDRRQSAPWYGTKATPSFEDMVDALRHRLQQQRGGRHVFHQPVVADPPTFLKQLRLIWKGKRLSVVVELTRPVGAGGMTVEVKSSRPKLMKVPPVAIARGHATGQAEVAIGRDYRGGESIAFQATVNGSRKRTVLSLDMPGRYSKILSPGRE